MKLLINTSNLVVGGAVQVAVSFLNEVKNLLHSDCLVFLSESVSLQINQEEFPDNFKFILIKKSPAKLITRYSVLKKLKYEEALFEPDFVFSIFGPSYWRPKAKHIVGYADPWVLNPKAKAYQLLPTIKKIKKKIESRLKKYVVKSTSDFYFVESEDAKKKLVSNLHINQDEVKVVPNTCNAFFEDKSLLDPNSERFLKLDLESNSFNFVYITHNYPHKNIKLIKAILPYIDPSVRFYLTIDSEDFFDIFGKKSSQVINLGPVASFNCPSIYYQVDALFMPSVLEVFSASYPEAMKMGKPILCSDFQFAKSVCDNAAMYFDPFDLQDVIKKTNEFISNQELRENLVLKGYSRLKRFGNARARALSYLEFINDLKD